MQCLFAADRDCPGLHHYLDPFAPLLFRFLRDIARQAGPRLRRLQLCGVLPQLPGILPVLLGLGYRTFSVEATSLPSMAQTVRRIDMVSASRLAAQVCAATESRQVLELLGLPARDHRSYVEPL
jgi:phosphoenolpyruvate-protein kinase (PTS system EI component)